MQQKARKIPAKTAAKTSAILPKNQHEILTFWLWWWHECVSAYWSVDTEWQTALPLCLPEVLVHCAAKETKETFRMGWLFCNSVHYRELQSIIWAVIEYVQATDGPEKEHTSVSVVFSSSPQSQVVLRPFNIVPEILSACPFKDSCSLSL